MTNAWGRALSQFGEPRATSTHQASRAHDPTRKLQAGNAELPGREQSGERRP